MNGLKIKKAYNGRHVGKIVGWHFDYNRLIGHIKLTTRGLRMMDTLNEPPVIIPVVEELQMCLHCGINYRMDKYQTCPVCNKGNYERP